MFASVKSLYLSSKNPTVSVKKPSVTPYNELNFKSPTTTVNPKSLFPSKDGPSHWNQKTMESLNLGLRNNPSAHLDDLLLFASSFKGVKNKAPQKIENIISVFTGINTFTKLSNNSLLNREKLSQIHNILFNEIVDAKNTIKHSTFRCREAHWEPHKVALKQLFPDLDKGLFGSCQTYQKKEVNISEALSHYEDSLTNIEEPSTKVSILEGDNLTMDPDVYGRAVVSLFEDDKKTGHFFFSSVKKENTNRLFDSFSDRSELFLIKTIAKSVMNTLTGDFLDTSDAHESPDPENQLIKYVFLMLLTQGTSDSPNYHELSFLVTHMDHLLEKKCEKKFVESPLEYSRCFTHALGVENLFHFEGSEPPANGSLTIRYPGKHTGRADMPKFIVTGSNQPKDITLQVDGYKHLRIVNYYYGNPKASPEFSLYNMTDGIKK
jgi:hypothetical protein